MITFSSKVGLPIPALYAELSRGHFPAWFLPFPLSYFLLLLESWLYNLLRNGTSHHEDEI